MIQTPISPVVANNVRSLVGVETNPAIKVNLDALVTNSMLKTPAGGVFKWEDQSGNLNHANQTLVASQPIISTAFGKPGVEFDEDDDFMTIPFSLDWATQQFTILVVATKLNLATASGMVSNRDIATMPTRWWTMGQNVANSMEVERSGSGTFPSVGYGIDARGLAPQIYEFSRNGSDFAYLNGTLTQSKGKVDIGGVSQTLIIGRWFTATQGWGGLLNQIQVRTDLFDAAKRASVVASLNAKWQ